MVETIPKTGGHTNMNPDLKHCPYHKPDNPDCGNKKKCPMLIIEGYAECTALTDQQIAMVMGWVTGQAQERK